MKDENEAKKDSKNERMRKERKEKREKMLNERQKESFNKKERITKKTYTAVNERIEGEENSFSWKTQKYTNQTQKKSTARKERQGQINGRKENKEKKQVTQ